MGAPLKSRPTLLYYAVGQPSLISSIYFNGSIDEEFHLFYLTSFFVPHYI